MKTRLSAIVVSLVLLGALFGLSQEREKDGARPSLSEARMLDQLQQEDWILQAEALVYLSNHDVTEALTPIRALLNDPEESAWLRGQSLIAIAGISGLASLPEVSSYTSSAESHLRAACAGAIDALIDEAPQEIASQRSSIDACLEKLYVDSDPIVRARSLSVFARLDPVAAWPGVETFLTNKEWRSAQSDRWMARALGWISNAAALTHLEALTRRSSSRAAILRGLDGVQRPQLLPFVLNLMSRHSSGSRTYASILTLLQRYDRNTLTAALETQLGDKKTSTLVSVAQLITSLVRDPDLGESLRAALTGVSDARAIYAGLVALGAKELQPDRHRELFIEHLKNPDSEIRALAIRCLSHCESVNLYSLLGESVLDPDPSVAQAALQALLRAPTEQAPAGRLVEYLQSVLISKNETARELGFELLGRAGSEEDFDPAVDFLESKLKGDNHRDRVLAARALGGIAPPEGIVRVVRTQGYLSQWRVIGTFLNDEKNTGFETAYPPESEIDFEAKYLSKYVWTLEGNRRDDDLEREVSWSKVATERTDGKLDMPPILPPPAALAVAYAVADFTVEQDRDAVLDIDGDDALRVWLNDEKIGEGTAPFKPRQPCVASLGMIRVRLRKGRNRLLIKSASISDDWWVRVRVTDAEGLPVEVRE